MQINRWLMRVATAAALGVIGSTAVHAQMGAAQAPRGADMNRGMSPEVMQVTTLTDEQVKNFFDASAELRAKNKGTNSAVGAKRMGGAGKGAQLSAEGLAIISKYGFKDATEFQRVGYNVGMAYMALRQGGKEAAKKQLDAAQAQQAVEIDKKRGQFSAAQLKALESRKDATVNAAKVMEDVPDSNIKIVEKYKDRMQPTRKK